MSRVSSKIEQPASCEQANKSGGKANKGARARAPARPRGFTVIKTHGKAVSEELIQASNRMKKSLATVQEESKVMAW